jgi:hypothetical protein
MILEYLSKRGSKYQYFIEFCRNFGFIIEVIAKKRESLVFYPQHLFATYPEVEAGLSYILKQIKDK